ncbi:MAG: periplasmic heavy metal sensor [Myxococcales bacterium]|nr:periplasmic heavy metal sensor [Myxococcales bacterium]
MLSLKTTILTSLLTLGLVGGALEGEAAAGEPGGGGHSKVERLCKRLECSADQTTQLQAIGKRVAEESRGDREALKTLKGQLAAEIAKDRPSEATLKKIFADMNRRQDAIQGRMQAALIEAHKLLTSSQRAELAKMIEKRGPKAMFFGGGHGGKGHGGKGKGHGDGKGRGDGKAHGKGKDQGKGKGAGRPVGASQLG